MGDRVGSQPCGCPSPAPGGFEGLVDPACEVLLELDERDQLLDGFPHRSALLTAALCDQRDLAAVLPRGVAALIVDRAAVVRTCGEPTSFEVAGLRGRIAGRGRVVAVLLRGLDVRPADELARATTSDESFWQLFDAAPLPLAIEIATTPTGTAASRLNRKFTEVFGYTSEDVPTVHHWWPLAYPDPVYRARMRDEWFRRVQRAAAEQSAIAPMEATVRCKDGTSREIEFFAAAVGDRHVVIFVDLTERKRAARQLRDAQAEVAALSDLLPVCAWCKKLRDDRGYWQMVEEFIARRTGARITHGICPDCSARLRAQGSQG